ncbi:LuxR C-terminal-related transcriptional regulator [Sphaerisporangium fuscum]|uniref:LuxR C-terminal-related transcriptional regulator n=1 Tax=Sphaerisporangium fuscum TaxID=2835868 RepID=UPI001BDBDC27|nr:LuxR C-terminal-related transcriptional regulator [Sphaerisporangium fuscum]
MTAASECRRVRGGLPAEVTSFVGRRHETAEIKRLLSASRLVTLTGVGGVGKSRLALRVASEVRRAFPGGAWLVELAPLGNGELVPQAVAETLEVQDYSSRSPMEVLLEHLAGRQALIVLDNCEHLLHECAVLADTLLRSLPDLRILATSRQPLGIASEQIMDVAPLSFSTGPADSPAQGDAVQLFAERASAVVPGFEVTPANRETVLAICRRLDGLPLAIELATVRLRALSVEQVLDRLDDRFRLLTAGSPAALPRQRTLRALIDWSHDLCTEQERLLWQHASVFSGGLDLEAAEEVCFGEGIARDEVLDLVTGLVEKSILVREEHTGGVRYRLLETIRQYGGERLADSGQETALRRRHRDHYRTLAAEAYAKLFGPSQVALLARLQREHPNLRAALEWSFNEPGEAERGLAMAADLIFHWITARHAGEGRRWLERGLALVPGPSPIRARALWCQGWLAIVQSDLAPAARMLEESRAVAESLGLASDLAYATLFSGMIAMSRGDADTAAASFEEAFHAHRALEDPAGQALALIRLAMANSLRGDAAAAIAAAEEGLLVCDSHGEGWHRAYAMMALGVEVWRQGDRRRATETEKDSLRFNRTVDDMFGVGLNMEVLSWVAVQEGDHERAAVLMGILDCVWRAVGAPLCGYRPLMKYHVEYRARTIEAMGEAAFRAAAQRGTRLPYDEAVLYALEGDVPEQEAPAPAGEAGPRGRLGPLTRRESEIAQLVARGMSNKDIAATLVISQRTAEGHIEHILDKLGFNSRTQIAAWVSERGQGAAS